MFSLACLTALCWGFLAAWFVALKKVRSERYSSTYWRLPLVTFDAGMLDDLLLSLGHAILTFAVGLVIAFALLAPVCVAIQACTPVSAEATR